MSIATSAVNAGMTIPDIWGIKRFGRRLLLLFGAFRTIICAIVNSNTSPGNQFYNLRRSHFFACKSLLRRCMGIPSMGRPRRDIPSESPREGNVTLNCLVWLWDFGIALPVSLFSSQASVPDRFLLSDLAAPYLVNSGHGNAKFGTKVFYIWGPMCFCCSSLHTSASPRQVPFS